MNELFLNAADGYPLCIHHFPVKNPHAVIQIIHGMEEHQERYEHFVGFLNEQHFSVVTSDLRGHGKHAPALGYFHDTQGDTLLVSDQLLIRSYIQKEYPDTPVYLFAHSMGTIISRVLLKTASSQYQRVVLCGYPNHQRHVRLALLCSTVIQKIHGTGYKSAFLQNQSVGAFNRAVPNPSTSADWICSNPDTVSAYLEDPLCGIGFTCSAFHALYRLVIAMHRTKHCSDIFQTLPIFCICGEADPCTGGQKGRADSIRTMHRQGFSCITQKTYPALRHELLNEKERDTIYRDIVEFYKAAPTA